MSSTFDGWSIVNDPDALMHFRTKGSRNGVRRYQNEDGTWTPLGLKERRAREGFGESRAERKANKKLAKAEKKVIRSEKKMARKERKEARKEKRRLNSIKGLTDEELARKIKRVEMEQKYREMTKSPLLKSGEKLVNLYMQHKIKKENDRIEREKRELDIMRQYTERIKAKEATKQAAQNAIQAQAEARKAKSESKTKKWDVKGGLATERKANLIQRKIGMRNMTIRGGISKRINDMLTAGKKSEYSAEREAKGKRAAELILNGEYDRHIRSGLGVRYDDTLKTKDEETRKRLGLKK